jgi:SAM-dependent methyltransferase
MNPEQRQYWEDKAIKQYQTGKYEVYRADTDEWINIQGIIENILEGQKKIKVLDVGSGYGQIFNHLRKAIPAIEKDYRMLDITPSMADVCEANTGVRPRLYNGEKLPYKDQSFDLVISFSIMLHMPFQQAIDHLLECLRVGKMVFIASWSDQETKKNLKPYNYNHFYPAVFNETIKFYDFIEYRTSLHGRVNFLLSEGSLGEFNNDPDKIIHVHTEILPDEDDDDSEI